MHGPGQRTLITNSLTVFDLPRLRWNFLYITMDQGLGREYPHMYPWHLPSSPKVSWKTYVHRMWSTPGFDIRVVIHDPHDSVTAVFLSYAAILR